jgi:glycerophosphoryl diester phosphodiesterase
MPNLKFIFAILIATAQLTAIGQTTTIEEFLIRKANHEVMVAAHRGDWKNYPENSLPAIQSCIDNFIDIVEIDVQETSDGKFILMHDNSVNRTTNGKGAVNSLSSNQISKLKLKNRNGELTDEHVPTLEEALTLAKGKVLINLDKSSGRFEKLLPIIDALGVRNQVILKGSHGSNFFFNYMIQNPEGPLFMPILQYQPKTQLDTFLLEASVPLVELLLSNDSSYITSPVGMNLFRTHRTGIWYNALFKSISAGKSENSDALGTWNWFIEHEALVIQTDWPMELLQHLINIGKHNRPYDYKDILLIKLPKPKN